MAAYLAFKSRIHDKIGNIQKDRTVASELLQDVSEYIGENKERHKDVGQVAAKYLETLQRSNEQLVKLTSMLQKMEDLDYGDLSGDDKDKLFDSFDAIGEDD